MPDSFEESIRMYYSQHSDNPNDRASSVRSNHHHQHQRRQDDVGGGILPKLINNVLEDMKRMGTLHASLHEINELVKVANDAPTMAALRNRLNSDFQCLLELAKQINKKFDSLVAANAAQRGRTFGASDDERTRAAMISELAENIKVMMRDFQGLRVQMEIDHRQLIEKRYMAVTGERATAEAIDNLIANRASSSSGVAVGSDAYQAVAEIQVRRDTMMEIRTNLMSLHQIFLGISTPPVEPPAAGGNQQQQQLSISYRRETSAPSFPRNEQQQQNSFPATTTTAAGGGGGLNDYERETRKQANIAIAIAVFVMFFVILALFTQDQSFERADPDFQMPNP